MWLNLELFERYGQALTLSAAGKAYLEDVRTALESRRYDCNRLRTWRKASFIAILTQSNRQLCMLLVFSKSD